MITNNSLLSSGRSKKPFIKLILTVEHDGEIFALTSRWYSDMRNLIKIGVTRPALSDERSGEAYLKTLSENPL